MREPDTDTGWQHLLTLCDADDCCPQVFYHESAPVDYSVRIEDDYGNVVFFSPGELLEARLIPMEGGPEAWALRDCFGNEAYMTPDQLAVLHTADNLQLIGDLHS